MANRQFAKEVLPSLSSDSSPQFEAAAPGKRGPMKIFMAKVWLATSLQLTLGHSEERSNEGSGFRPATQNPDPSLCSG
jgi:hypothetical protein